MKSGGAKIFSAKHFSEKPPFRNHLLASQRLPAKSTLQNAGSLFVAHGLGRLNDAHDETGQHEGKQRDDQRAGVDEQEEGDVERHGGAVDIVDRGVEAHDAEEMLQGEYAQPHSVAPQHAAREDEGGEPEKHAAHRAAARAEGFEQADVARAFQY